MEKTLVVKVSGSLLYPPREDYVGGLADSVRRALDLVDRVIVVTGGGGLARDLIRVARSLGASHGVGDLLGIEAARLNARLLAGLLYPLAPLDPPRSVQELAAVLPLYRLVVAGGFQPGQSTNAVSMLAAEIAGSRLVVNLLRGVPGVYRRYPPGPGEEPLRCISLGELRSIVAGSSQEPGKYVLIDHIALEIAARSSIRILFADGSDPRVIVDAARGRAVGTLVVPPGESCP